MRINGTGGEETCGVVDGCVITCTWVELLAELNLVPGGEGEGGGERTVQGWLAVSAAERILLSDGTLQQGWYRTTEACKYAAMQLPIVQVCAQ